jgi:hypothetical protein
MLLLGERPKAFALRGSVAGLISATPSSIAAAYIAEMVARISRIVSLDRPRSCLSTSNRFTCERCSCATFICAKAGATCERKSPV